MDKVNVLITGAGAPGIAGTLYSLKNNYDNRDVKTVGTDIKKEVVGKYICDKFYQIPKPNEKNFIPKLMKICEKEKIDVILPQVTKELLPLSKNKKKFEKIGSKVAISNYETIKKSNNKYELIKLCKEIGIPYTEFYLVNTLKELKKKVYALGYPKKKVCIKPPISSGMRGFRVLIPKKSKKDFYEEKPTGIYSSIEELQEFLGEKFPELLITEYLPGKEYSVDCFRNREKCIVIPRSRDLIRTGITFNGTVEKNEKIIIYSKKIAEKLDMKFCFGFQFKLDSNGIPKIIESNPRIQGTMIMSTFAGANIIYSAVKEALGEKIPNFKIKWGLKFMRYWGGIGIDGKKIKKLEL